MTTETQQTFTVATANDSTPEPAETFLVHLSNPGGCTINPNFSVGPDARVTILDNDAATTTPTTAPPATTASTSAPRTTRPAVATPATPSPATSPDTTVAAAVTTAAPEPASPTGTEATTAVPVREAATEADGKDDDDGRSGGAIAVAIAAIALLGGVGYLLYRRRASLGP